MSYKISKYPDGTSYATVTNLNTTEDTIRINSYEDLWHLNQVVDAYNHQGVVPIVTIPNLLDAQADRRFADNESSGLKLICKFLNGMNASFRIFHPHNPEVVEMMLDNVEIIDNSEFVVKVLDDNLYGNQTALENSLILMSSDAGGFKPLMKTCEKIGWKGETFSAGKARSWSKDGNSKLVQEIDRQDFGGKDILIIDDLSIYGGTFKGLSKLLKERNCGKLYLAVSHMTVQDLGEDPVTGYFDKVFTTNSKFNKYYCVDKEVARPNDFDTYNPTNLEVIKLFL